MKSHSPIDLSLLVTVMFVGFVPVLPFAAGAAPQQAEATVAPSCDEIWHLPFGDRLKALRDHPECRQPVVVDTQSMGSSHGDAPSEPVFYSDARLKRDIVPLGTANGFQLYGFRYLNQETEYVGVMAQDILGRAPAAIIRRPDGFMQVNYAALGLRMVTLDQWHASPSSILR